MKLKGFIQFIKFTNAYTHREREGMRKVETNETKFVSVFLVKSIYTSSFGCMKFYFDN